MTKHLDENVNLGSKFVGRYKIYTYYKNHYQHNWFFTGMRVPYKSTQDTFTEDKLSSLEPMGQFDTWFKEASQTPGISEPNAMCLATATK